MAWTQQGSIKGAPGAAGTPGTPGTPGRGISTAAIQGDGTLLLTFSDNTSLNVGLVKGLNGTDGKSVSIVGSVANAAALPSNLGSGDAGKGYITSDDGHLRVWGGSSFTDVGQVQGPPGPQGNPGIQGPRGAGWFYGNGAPSNVNGALPGDLYLDFTDGRIYTLS